jgi:hypothetical protein
VDIVIYINIHICICMEGVDDVNEGRGLGSWAIWARAAHGVQVKRTHAGNWHEAYGICSTARLTSGGRVFALGMR